MYTVAGTTAPGGRRARVQPAAEKLLVKEKKKKEKKSIGSRRGRLTKLGAGGLGGPG